MKNKFYTLHLHCAIGPRRDPWLGAPESDSSTGPYRDAYVRAYNACYGPNTSAAFREDGDLVTDLRNNFERVSFDAAPELMTWLESHRPRVYGKLIEADRLQLREHGHGGALAVPHPPLILPLASRADKRTAIRWGKDDFRMRFGRDPEGIWLPENAIDEETAEVLIEEGFRFTVIARTQAARVRPLGSDDDSWTEVLPERLDPRRPYRWLSRERPGQWLGVFATRGDLTPKKMLARNALAEDDAVAVDACQGFSNKLVDSLTANEAAELAHLAMDAEWFGLVHPYGERALAYTLDLLEREAPALRTNYASFLDLFPPPQEIDLKPVSARSCTHGLERWRGICECRNPEAPDKSPSWRGPLRKALETLAARATDAIESFTEKLTRHGLKSLDAAAPILFSNDPDRVEAFLAIAARRHPTPIQARQLLRAVEIRRASLAALSHWTWQGDDAASNEAVQALLEAARTIDVLALEMPERAAELEIDLQNALTEVQVEGGGDSADLYRRLSRPRRVSAKRASAHAALLEMALERAPLLPILDAPNWETTLRPLCRRDLPSREGAATVRIFEVSTRDKKIFTAFNGIAVALDSGGTSLECWIGEVESPDTTAATLERIFVDNGPEALRTAATEALGNETWGLDGLLGETRRAAIREFSARRGADPDADEVQARWELLLGSLTKETLDPTRVAQVLLQSAPLVKELESVRGVDRVQDALAAHAARFAQSPSPETLSTFTRLLEAAQTSHFPLSIWEVRELGQLGLARAQGSLPDEDKKALLSLLNLAEKSVAREERWSPAN